MPNSDRITQCARGWLGTPYHHQGSVRGAGCDCLGLIRGIWRELYGPEPEAMPPYSRDWGNVTGSETLIAAACRHLVQLEDASLAEPGDVLVFRMRDKGVAKHAGVLLSALPASGLLERDVSALPASLLPYRPSDYLRAGLLERDVSALPASLLPYRPPDYLRAGLLERDVSALPASGLSKQDTRASRHLRNKSGNDEELWDMIHAQEGLGVVETPLGSWWRRRIVAAFRFPS